MINSVSPTCTNNNNRKNISTTNSCTEINNNQKADTVTFASSTLIEDKSLLIQKDIKNLEANHLRKIRNLDSLKTAELIIDANRICSNLCKYARLEAKTLDLYSKKGFAVPNLQISTLSLTSTDELTPIQAKVAQSIAKYNLLIAGELIKSAHAGKWEEADNAKKCAKNAYRIASTAKLDPSIKADAAEIVAQSYIYQGDFLRAKHYLIQAFEHNLTSSRTNNPKNVPVLEMLSALTYPQNTKKKLTQILNKHIDNVNELDVLSKGIQYHLFETKTPTKSYWKFVATEQQAIKALKDKDYRETERLANEALAYLDESKSGFKNSALGKQLFQKLSTESDIHEASRNEVKPCFTLACALHGQGKYVEACLEYNKVMNITMKASIYNIISRKLGVDAFEHNPIDREAIQDINDFYLDNNS